MHKRNQPFSERHGYYSDIEVCDIPKVVLAITFALKCNPGLMVIENVQLIE